MLMGPRDLAARLSEGPRNRDNSVGFGLIDRLKVTEPCRLGETLLLQ